MALVGIRQPVEDILTHLKAMNELSFVAKYNSQFDNLEDGSIYSYPFPCAFLEVVLPNSYQPLLGGVMAADLVFRVHLGVNFFNDADDLMEQNFIVFDLKDKIVRALHLFNPTNCSSLIKVSEEQDYNHNNVYHYTIDFATTFIDTVANQTDTTTGDVIEIEGGTIGLDIDVELQTFNYLRLNLMAGFDDSFNDDFDTGATIEENTYGDLLSPEYNQYREYLI